MTQSTSVGAVPDGSGISVRTALNLADVSIITEHEGTSAPTVTYPNQAWRNPTTKFLYRRNQQNNGWITVLNYGATAAPTVNDDVADGYEQGSLWRDVTNKKNYECMNPAAGAAVWHETASIADPFEVVNLQTETAFDATADYFAMRDTSAGGDRKIIPQRIGVPDILTSPYLDRIYKISYKDDDAGSKLRAIIAAITSASATPFYYIEIDGPCTIGRDGSNNWCLKLNARNLVISGIGRSAEIKHAFTADASAWPLLYASSLTGVSVVLENLTLRGTWSDQVDKQTVNGASLIDITGPRRAYLHHIHAFDCVEHAFQIVDCGIGRVENCHIERTTKTGVLMAGRDVTVRNSTIAYTRGPCISVSVPSGVADDENYTRLGRIVDCSTLQTGGILVGAPRVAVQRNMIDMPFNYGIRVITDLSGEAEIIPQEITICDNKIFNVVANDQCGQPIAVNKSILVESAARAAKNLTIERNQIASTFGALWTGSSYQTPSVLKRGLTTADDALGLYNISGFSNAWQSPNTASLEPIHQRCPAVYVITPNGVGYGGVICERNSARGANPTETIAIGYAAFAGNQSWTIPSVEAAWNGVAVTKHNLDSRLFDIKFDVVKLDITIGNALYASAIVAVQYSLDGVSGWTDIATRTLGRVAASATIVAGGSGYQVGNTLTAGGATWTVSTVSSGAVTAVTLASASEITTNPANPIATTGGAGTGCTLNITWQSEYTLAGTYAAIPQTGIIYTRIVGRSGDGSTATTITGINVVFARQGDTLGTEDDIRSGSGGTINDWTESVAGKVRRATQAEAQALTNNVAAVTPARVNDGIIAARAVPESWGETSAAEYLVSRSAIVSLAGNSRIILPAPGGIKQCLVKNRSGGAVTVLANEGKQAGGAYFNGSSYLDFVGLSGIPASWDKFVFSCWLSADTMPPSAASYIFSFTRVTSTDRGGIEMRVTGSPEFIDVYGYRSDTPGGSTQVTVLTKRTTINPFAQGQCAHIVCACDLSVPVFKMYINGVAATYQGSPSVLTAGETMTPPGGGVPFRLGARSTAAVNFWFGNIAQFWFAPGFYLDLASGPNLALFYSGGAAINYGFSGWRPRGALASVPALYLNRNGSEFATNQANTSEVGTTTGTLASPTLTVSGQEAALTIAGQGSSFSLADGKAASFGLHDDGARYELVGGA